jgi:imidazolonepropionase-like amidohydrolase
LKNGNRAPALALTLTLAPALFLTLSGASARAQDDDLYAITGARLVTLAGPAIDDGTVVVRRGKISEVGRSVAIPPGARVIDARGLEVYPGIMDAVSQLGLTEIGSTAATVDTVELGDFNPQIRAATAIHPASEHIPVARANGITHAVSAPGSFGGFFGGDGFGFQGQASLVNLDGWTVEEMSIAPSVGMVLQWPSIRTEDLDLDTFESKPVPYETASKEHEERLARLEDWIDAARRYASASASANPGGRASEGGERDLKLEALVPVIEKKLPLLVLAEKERDIRDAVAFSEKEDLRMVLLGGRDGWKAKDLLREKGIPVILGPTQELPATEDEPYDQPYATAGQLQKAGVRVVFGSFGSADSRLLPHEVGNAVAYGLPWEEGLKSITLYPAELFGVSDRLGTIEEGKIANLIVTDGDPLEIRTQVRYLFVNGRLTSLDNKQLRLYEKYRARP